jgi:hypothetical protein
LADVRKRLLGHDGRCDRAALVVVYGWPGAGKTTLSVALAHDHETHDRFRDGVVWVAVGKLTTEKREEQLLERFRQIGDGLGYPESVKWNTCRKARSDLREAAKPRSTLLILDDVWDMADALELAVVGPKGAVLITTRVTREAIDPNLGQHGYELKGLPEGEGLRLLHEASHEASRAYPDESKQLAEKLQYLPLGLTVAGPLIQKAPPGTARSLIRDLADDSRMIDAKLPPDLIQQMPNRTVAALLCRSTDELDPWARIYFAALGRMRDDVLTWYPAAFLGDIWSALRKSEAVRTTDQIAQHLVDWGLLEERRNGQDGPLAYRTHALLLLLAKSMLKRKPGASQ